MRKAMRGKIRLDARKNSFTKKGFPIIIYLTKDSKVKIVQTGFHTLKKDWDKNKALPKKSHPHFLNLLNYLEHKKIRMNHFISSQEFATLEQAKAYILDFDNALFVEQGLSYAEKHKLKRTYAIALKAFDKMFPSLPYDLVTKEVAISFRDQILKIPVNGKPRSPNGVKSYLSSLSSIWNKLGKENNPFSKVTVKSVPTRSKALTVDDVIKIKSNNFTPHLNANFGGYYHYLNYWLLCFYLGGCDLFDLCGLRWSDVVNNRVEFVRGKGGTEAFVSNYIFPQAMEILEIYKGTEFLIPLRRNKLHNFHGNTNRIYQDIKDKLGLSRKPYSKSPRYTFINIGRELFVDRRVMEEIVGHTSGDTHSIYEGNYPISVRDREHKRVINAPNL